MATPEPQSIAEYINWNVALVKDVNAQIQQRISSSVFAGYTARRPVRDIAKEIDEAVGLGKARSRRIAQDQTSKLSAALDRERRAEAGITQYLYRHSRKLHPRSWHKPRDNHVYDSATGKSVDGGPDIPANDRAGMAPFCGCREQAYLNLDD